MLKPSSFTRIFRKCQRASCRKIESECVSTRQLCVKKIRVKHIPNVPFRRFFKNILSIIPLPVPNWASAEEQFIPNYPPQITIYSKFFFENPNFSLSTKFFDLSWTYETIKHKLRERRCALFHSTPGGPIDRGTIQQAIWSETQIYLMVTKTFARFSPDFI